MKTAFSSLRNIILTLLVACTVTLVYTSMTRPATAHKDSSPIPCNPEAAYQAVIGTKKAGICIDDALAVHPGWIINHSVQETPGCPGPTGMRGCTYVVSIWISCPYPGCMAPDYLVLDADVSCTFEVLTLTCY